MQLFPERDRRGRNFLVVALTVSLLVHLAGGGAWLLYARRVAPVLAKLLPRPTPAPEEVAATSDAITIERRTVPRAAHRMPSQTPPLPRPPSRPATVAALPLPPVPTLRPLPTSAPATEPAAPPTYHPRLATIHHPRTDRRAEPAARPRAEPVQVARNAFSPRQAEALDAQFRRTIAQAQRSLSEVTPPSRPPATTKRYSLIFTGRKSDLDYTQGQCHSLSSFTRGNRVWHYLQCDYQYPDGYVETVNWPWPFSFPRGADPMDVEGAIFPNQNPPPGFVLPAPFALSRAVCTYFVERCEAVIHAEQQNGGAPPP